MPKGDPLAGVVAAIAAFLASGAYYAVLGNRLAEVSDAPAAGAGGPWMIPVESCCVVVATVVAGLAALGEVREPAPACCWASSCGPASPSSCGPAP